MQLIGNMMKSALRAIKLAPLVVMVAVVSYVTATQIVTPQHRMIKMGILGAVLVFMFRFDMIYSVLLFTVLFPYPSGITIGSTNSILLTLIALAWAIRATSTGRRIFVPTRYDWAIVLLLLSYVLSFYNTESTLQITNGLHMLWKQVAALIYFYAIIMFVYDEKRLFLFVKVVGIALSLVVVTGLIELFFPGTTLIPGWIDLKQLKGKGSLTFRIEGIRLGGAVGGHNVLADMAMLGLFYVLYLAMRARNPLERFLWTVSSFGTVVVLLATANRGAFVSLVLGGIYTVYRFSKRVSFTRMVVVGAVLLVAVIATQFVLDEYTYAVSMTDRLLATKFSGFTPDTRVGIWEHTFNRSLEHPFVGHGPWYDPGKGLTFQYWPHNAYLFYFYTIGLLGLGAFLWLSFLLIKRSFVFKRKEVWGTPLGDFAIILHVQICMFLFGQIRTDHQRDHIYIYVVYMLFALVATTANIVDQKVRDAAEP